MGDLDTLARLIQQHGDDWKLNSAVERLRNGQPPGYAADLLWRGFAAGLPIAEYAHYLFVLMISSPQSWDADALERLLRAMAARYPGGKHEGGSSGWWGESDIPGNSYTLWMLIGEKKGDAAFSEAMRGRWRDLPEPWRLAVGYDLAAHGHMPASELGDADRRRIARVHLAFGKGDYQIWTRPHGIPKAEWGPLLAEVTRTEPELAFNEPEVVLDLLPDVGPDALVDALLHTAHGVGTAEALRKLDQLGPDALPAFERKLPSLEVGPQPDYRKGAWGHALAAFTYLRLCQRAGRAPPPELDAYLGRVLARFRQPWGGGGVEAYHEAIWEALRVLPPERREPLVLGAGSFWDFAPACPTPAVLQRMVDAIAALPAKPDYDQKRLLDNLTGQAGSDYPKGILRPVVRELVPYATAALKAKKPPPQRQACVWVLAQSGLPEAAEGLALALGDSSKACRELARGALPGLPREAVLPALAAQLQSKRKDARAQAAQVLAALSAHRDTHALAAKHLATESVAEVREALEAVKAP